MEKAAATVRIDSRLVGPGQPVFLVAEAGTTANGDPQTAIQLADAAKAAGADAIKYMLLDPNEFMSSKDVFYEDARPSGPVCVRMYDLFKQLMFTPDEYRAIFAHCRDIGLLAYATVDNLPHMDLAQRLDLPCYKLSSWDIRFFPLIERMARTGKPIQIDLGPALYGEICQVLEDIRRWGNDQVILVHCTHAATAGEVNMRAIPYLQTALATRGCPVGWSADSRDDAPDLLAVALGANLIEKRLSLDPSTDGHHHAKSLSPIEFAEWVAKISQAQTMLGVEEVRPSHADLGMKDLYFTAIVAACGIEAGEIITPAHLACKRPPPLDSGRLNGISPKYLDRFYGKRATRDIPQNDLVVWTDV